MSGDEHGPEAPTEPEVTPVAPLVHPAIEPSALDVTSDAEIVLPGTHRGGFQRLPTAPVGVVAEIAPAEPGTIDVAPDVRWLVPEPEPPRRGLAAWALAFSIAGLIGSLVVGWAFPIGLVGIVSAILALRRPLESRAVAVWALVLGGVSILYSAGWLWFAALQAGLLG